MGIGPIPAVRKALERERRDARRDRPRRAERGVRRAESSPCIRELGLDPAKVNVNGGAIALGHPLGLSGARLVVTLLHELAPARRPYGLATLCVGVGQGQAALFERG